MLQEAAMEVIMREQVAEHQLFRYRPILRRLDFAALGAVPIAFMGRSTMLKNVRQHA